MTRLFSSEPGFICTMSVPDNLDPTVASALASLDRLSHSDIPNLVVHTLPLDHLVSVFDTIARPCSWHAFLLWMDGFTSNVISLDLDICHSKERMRTAVIRHPRNLSF
jgi:hypothetical protein